MSDLDAVKIVDCHTMNRQTVSQLSFMPSECNRDGVISDDELRQFAPAPRVDKREKKKARQQERNGGGDKAGAATFQVSTATTLVSFRRTGVS